MNILYYDCFAGISGNMNLAALLDLGLDYDELVLELAGLKIGGYSLQASRAARQGITGTQVRVVVDHGQPEHRDLRRIEEIIGASTLNDRVQARAVAVFRRLAQAEAHIHGTTPDRIHFHEVGAVDAIVDIVGGAIALERLNVDRVLCAPVELGGGLAHCAHGVLPVPAPATLELLKGVPVKLGTVPFEATTPTGAALLSCFVDEFVTQPAFQIHRIGYGIGHRDGPIPNVLRVLLGKTRGEEGGCSELSVLECNIDDMNPECYEHVLERLFTAGALDVWLTPVSMKKNRPGTLLGILCVPMLAPVLTQLLLIETTTLGVRQHTVLRTALRREIQRIDTCYGEIRVKIAYHHGRPLRAKPEYEDCKQRALDNGVAIYKVYEAVRATLGTQGLSSSGSMEESP